MFEHLRQLDAEIQEFSEDREILAAQSVHLLPEKAAQEQQKAREVQHHDMKLLEFDL